MTPKELQWSSSASRNKILGAWPSLSHSACTLTICLKKCDEERNLPRQYSPEIGIYDCSTIAKKTKYGLRIKLNDGKSIKSQLHRK